MHLRYRNSIKDYSKNLGMVNGFIGYYVVVS